MALLPSGHGPDMPSAATSVAVAEAGAGGAAPLFVGVWKCGGAGYWFPLEGVAWREDCAIVCVEARGMGCA